MAHIIADRVKDVSTTTGTGDFTLAATPDSTFRTFSDVMSASDTTFYAIVHRTLDEWEVGIATYAGGDVLERTTILSSSDGTTVVDFTAGAKDVAIVAPAGRMLPQLASIAQGSVIYAQLDNVIAALAKDANATRYLSNQGADNGPSWNQIDLTNGVAGSLPPANGGTGLTTLTQGDLFYASSGTVVSKLAKNTSSTRYLSNQGSNNDPSWNQVNAANGLTGIAPVANGGTGLATLTSNALYKGAGTSAMAASGLTDNGTTISTTENFSVGTSASITAGTIELGAATDTTISRSSAGVLAVEGVILDSKIQQNSQSTAYTTVLADAQKHILHPTADNNARTFTIAANASVAYPIGTCLTFVNQINTVTIAINTDTLTMAGTGQTGSRSLAANGIATALKITSTSWIISGAGLS
jgi:hypothetical protein